MAKLGTVFVELSLDDKVYKQRLSETLTSTQATAKGIEKSWQVLGQKSDETFNAQRRSYENALTLIKNSHNSTKQDIIRAEQAAANKIKEINERQFGHQTTLIEGLKKNWIAASVAIGAAMIAVNKSWDLAKIGADFAEQQGILNNLSLKYKTTALEIVSSMRTASEGMVANSDLMQVALEGISKGLKPEQLIELSNAAKMLADVTGEDTTTALQNLSQALETGRMKALKHYGGTIDLKDAFGELTDKLTAAEKAQAMYALIIQHTTELEKQQTKAVDGAADKMERMEASYNNAKLAAGNFFKTIIAGIYDMGVALASAPHIDESGSGVDIATTATKKPTAKPAKEKETPEGIISNIKKQAEAREKATKSIKDHTSAIRKEAKDHADIVDLWIKDEARKWEELEKYEEQYAKDKQKYEETMHSAYVESLSPAEQAIQKIRDAEKEKFDFIDLCVKKNVTTAEQAAADKLFIEKENAEKIKQINQEVADHQRKLENDTLNTRLHAVAYGFGALESACSDIASIYAEGSKEAQQWEEAAKAFEIAQRAVAVVQAVIGIATQAQGDPYTAFARVAAMAAAMGALLSSIGESVGGSSASVAAATSRTSSTALGSEEASQSLSNSLEILKDTYDVENVRLTQIYNEMRDLNNNITGLVTSIVRTGGISASGFGVTEGTESSYWANASWYHINKNLGILTSIGTFLNKPAADVIKYIGEGLFGGEKKTVIGKSGLAIGGGSLGGLLNGDDVSVRNWARVFTETTGGLLKKGSVSYADIYKSANADVSRMFNLAYQNIGETLLTVAAALGEDTKKVMDYTFGASKLNLKGKSTEEINTAVQNYFSTISDNAAKALFGDLLTQYQQLNEGLMETAVRLISDKETIAAILEMTNKTFSGTTSQFIKFSEALIDVSGSLDDLTNAFSSYYDAFFTDAEKQADYKKQLSGVMGSYGFALPTNRAGYRDIVESLNLTTDAGMTAYYALLAVSETADKYYDYLENARSSVSESQFATKVEYERAVRGYASGGVASGLAWVGEHGKELAYFEQPTKIYSNSDSGKIISQGELIAEVRSLRESVEAGNSAIATTNAKIAKYTQFLEQWDAEGIPEERT